jgi:hypothetical protein
VGRLGGAAVTGEVLGRADPGAAEATAAVRGGHVQAVKPRVGRDAAAGPADAHGADDTAGGLGDQSGLGAGGEACGRTFG